MDPSSFDLNQEPPRFSPAIESFLEKIKSEFPFGQRNCEYCVELHVVMQRIDDISSGAHQWTCLPATSLMVGKQKRRCDWLVVGYSNPNSECLPNLLSYCFPIIFDRDKDGGGSRLLVCFAPDSMHPLCRGLYWEEDELKCDCFEDWERFWEPLRRSLWPPTAEEYPLNPTYRDLHLSLPNIKTLEGVTYRESIEGHVRLWAKSKAALQKVISW
jgi:hypothetical protein